MPTIIEARHLAFHDLGRTLEAVPRRIDGVPSPGKVMGSIVAISARGTLCIAHLQVDPKTELAVWLQPGDLVRISGKPSPPPIPPGTRLEGPLLPILPCKPDTPEGEPRPDNTAAPQ